MHTPGARIRIALLVCFYAVLSAETVSAQPAEILIQNGHSAGINIVVFSPDGGVLATAGDDNVIKLWETSTRRLLWNIPTSGVCNISSGAFSPDASLIAVGVGGGMVQVWDIRTCELRRTLDHGSNVVAAAFSPDGRLIASTGNKEFRLWDAATGTVRFVLSTDDYITPEAIVFSPDSSLIAGLCSRGFIRLWRTADGASAGTLREPGDDQKVLSLVFSPDGGTLASGRSDKTVKLWSVLERRVIGTLERFPGYVSSLAISSDGSMLAAGAGYSVQLWNLKSRTLVVSLGSEEQFYGWPVTTLTFHPGGGMLVVGGSDHLVRFWEVPSGKERAILSQYTPKLYKISTDPGGRTVAAGCEDGYVRVWDIASGALKHSLPGPGSYLNSFEMSSDGRTIAASYEDGSVKIWDAGDGTLVRSIQAHAKPVVFQFSPDGVMIATSSWEPVLKLWETRTGRLLRALEGHTDTVHAFAFSPTGPLFASAANDNKLILWNLETGKIVHTLSTQRTPKSLQFSPDGAVLCSSHPDGTIRLWDTRTGIEKAILQKHDIMHGSPTVFSPDGKLLATGRPDGSSVIWEVSTGRQVAVLQDGTSQVFSLQFDPSGKTLSSGHEDGTIRLWGIGTRSIIATIPAHNDIVWRLVFDSTGRRLFSSSSDMSIRIWDVRTGRSLATLIAAAFGGDWITYTDEGFFAGTVEASELITYRVKGLGVVGIDQLYDLFYRPDLVQAKLAGEDIGRFAAELNLRRVLDGGVPPVVQFTTRPTTTSVRDLELTIRVTDAGGGIGKIVLYLDGAPVTIAEGMRGLTVSSVSGATVKSWEIRHTVTLRSGTNFIGISAWNEQNRIESIRDTLTISWDGKGEKPHLYILAVAIDQYRDKALRLKYSVADAEAVTATLSTRAQTLYTGSTVVKLYNSDVTVSNLSTVFEELSSKVKADDVFVFYLSGHGVAWDQDGDYYFLPVDFRYTGSSAIGVAGISKAAILNNLEKIRAGKSLLFFDTCNSGSFIDPNGEAPGRRSISEKTAIDRLMRGLGRAVIVASADDQSALEGYEGHGVFTWVLVDGLKGNADINKDGYTSVTELSLYIESMVPQISYRKWGYEQIPQKDLPKEDFPVVKNSGF